MGQLNYLAVLAACLLGTLPLEWLGEGVYRRPRRLLSAMAIPLVLFVGWDVFATERGHWWFDAEQTLGPRIGPLPIEELLFFLVIPLCALLTIEAVRGLLGRLGGRQREAAPSAALERELELDDA